MVGGPSMPYPDQKVKSAQFLLLALRYSKLGHNFVFLFVLNNMPPIITSKANPRRKTHMEVIQASKVVNLTGYWPCVRLKFSGWAGVVTPSNPSPYKQLLPLPSPCFKMFLEGSLNDPHPTTPLQASFTATPLPIHHLPPPKNFDHTPYLSIHLFVSSALKKSGYCNNLETLEVLVGTIPSANLTFHAFR